MAFLNFNEGFFFNGSFDAVTETDTFKKQARRHAADAKRVDDVEKEIASGTKTMVVGPYLTRIKPRPGEEIRINSRHPEARLAEAVGLAAAIDLDVEKTALVMLDKPTPATFLGSGKVETLSQEIAEAEIDLVIMDAALSPVQQRNLERAFKAKVIDRTGLILEIFGRRARTKEGRLQVELAHLAYQKSRLVRSWTHLERQRGGFGFLGGPGETQIEADRRIIQDRMYRLEQDLESVKRTRGLHRAGRARTPYPIIALVGYTNAGKSSLFNRLTQADVMAEDLLFATLDPTARVVKLPHGAPIILSDTVGFISDLPTQLVAAFRATLEDVIEADLVLHVRDMAHADTDAQSQDVNAIMRDLGIDPDHHERLIEVWNKVDQLDADSRLNLINKAARSPEGERPHLTSALTGDGIEDLLKEIELKISNKKELYEIEVPAEAGELLAWLYREGEVLQREELEGGNLRMKVRMAKEKAAHLARRAPQSKRI